MFVQSHGGLANVNIVTRYLSHKCMLVRVFDLWTCDLGIIIKGFDVLNQEFVVFMF